MFMPWRRMRPQARLQRRARLLNDPMPSSSEQVPLPSWPRRVGVALLWLCLWQLLFWPLVHWAERAARPSSLSAAQSVEFQLLDDTGQALGGRRSAARVGLEGFVVSSEPGAARVIFAVPFSVEDPTRELALFLSLREQIREIRLNGSALQAIQSLPRLEGLLTSEPSYYTLPGELIRAGVNRLEVEKSLFGFDTALSEFAIGPADELAETYRWKSFLITDLGLISIGVQLFAILLMLAVNWPAEDRPRIRSLIALIACNTAGVYWLSFSPPIDLSLAQFVFCWGALNLGLSWAIVNFSVHDTGVIRSTARLRQMGVVLAAAYLLFWFTPGLTENESRLTKVLDVVYLVSAAAALLAMVWLADAAARPSRPRRFERTVLALCFSALALDRIGSMFNLHSPFDASLPLTLPWSPILGTLLGLSMVFALAREAAQARRTVVEANDRLARDLAAREAELEASYREHGEMLKRAAIHDERQRLMRDMHDGIGGELLSLKLRADAGALNDEQLRAGLDSTLNDLRLIVDSLDTAEDGLGLALVAFERRLRQQLSGVGCELLSTDAIGDANDQFGARVVLNVLRILQEAASNALRHGKATQLILHSGVDAASNGIVVSLQDNGSGMGASARSGQGLTSMHHRAAAIGARLELSSAAHGTCLKLSLPSL